MQHGEWFMVAVAVALSWLVVVVVVMLALTSPAQAQMQVLASYTMCGGHGTCAGPQTWVVACSPVARNEDEAFLRWAVATHRAAAADAGVALHALAPREVEIPRTQCRVDLDARMLTQ